MAGASFPTVRKGYDPDAVQRFLRDVAGALQRAHDRIDDLEHRLSSSPSTPAAATMDEDTATRLLGEEAARILQAAREASQQIRAKAEEAAGRLVREASEDAARLREEADLEAARRRADATSDAEAEIEMAKQQGREMVTEAREYRERVLADVARRRELARQQVEQLVHGRERLVQAFERARLAAVDVIGSLAPVATDTEFVSLEPTTGPIPLTGDEPELPAVEDAEDDLAEPEPPEAERVEAEPELEPAGSDEPADDTAALTVVPERDDDRVVQLPKRTGAGAADADTDDRDGGEGEDGDEDDEDDEDDDEGEPARVVALFAGEIDEPSSSTPEPEPEHDATGGAAVDDLFAKLRAASAEMVAREAAQDDEPAPEAGTEVADTSTVTPAGTADAAASEPAGDSPFARRDEALVPVIVATSRKMKRVLAEEQNSLFDAVRRQGGKRQELAGLDVLLMPLDEHVELYRSAIDDQLQIAALAGASSLSTASTTTIKRSLKDPGVLEPATEAVRSEVVGPLRERLERCHQEADGDPDGFVSLARSAYREWKSEHIDEHVDDLVQLAYGRGAFAVVAKNKRVCWLVDPDGPACPDAEDNALAGSVAKGEPFPTGHEHPPAHAGCRCLLGLAAE